MKTIHPPYCPWDRTIKTLRWLAVGVFAVWLLMALTGCATTSLYNVDGRPLLRTGADAQGIDYHGPNGIAFHADRLNHSTPTLAGGKAIGGAATAVGTAVAASGIIGLAH